jgi:hypothetical protein
VKTYLHLLDYVLWIVTIISECLLLVVAIRRGAGRALPRYVLYVGFLCFQASLLFAISQFLPYRFYFWTYYAGMAVETCMLMVVLYDVFRGVFDPLNSLLDRTVANLIASVVVISAVAITLAIWRPAVTTDSVTVFVRTFHRTTGFVVALSFWSLVMYARSLGIPWRMRIAGITGGFLLYLSVNSFTVAAVGYAPQSWFPWLDRIGNAAFLASVFVWMNAVQRKEEEEELQTPEALLQLRAAVEQMRNATGKLAVQRKTRWIAE